MRSLISGRLGAGVTFWVGLVAVSCVWLAWISLTWLLFPDRGWLTPRYPDPAEWLDWIVLVGLLAMLLRAMVRASYCNGRPTDWQWIGIALLAGSLMLNLAALALDLLPFEMRPRFALRWELREMNEWLPQDLGDGYVLHRIAMPDPDTILLRYSASIALQDPEITGEVVDLAATGESRQLCEDFDGYFRQGIRAIRFEYAYSNGLVREIIGGAECRVLLAR